MSLTVGELNATIGLDNRGFNRKLDESESKFRGFGSNINSMAGRIAPAAAAIGLSFGAVAAGMGLLAGKAIGMSAQMEQSRIAFATLLGGAQKADAFIRLMQKFAAKTPFTFIGLQDNAKRLLAMGFAAKDVLPTLTNVGDAVAALGSGEAGLNSITYALGQMKTSGKVHTQDMMQLTNAGIAAWQLLADKLHTTVAGAQEAVQRGEVSSETGLDAMMSGMHKRYGGLMEKQAHTVTGLFSNLQDIVNQSLTVVGNKIVETFDLKGKLGSITGFITSVTQGFQTGGIQGAIGGVFEGLGVASDAYAPAIQNVADAFKALGGSIGKVVGVVSGAISGAASIIFGKDGRGFWENLDGAIIVVAAVVGGILTAAFAALAIAVIAATWPLLLIGAGIGLVALGAYELFKHWGAVMKVLKPFTDIVGPKLNDLWKALQPAIKEVKDQLKPIGDEFGRAFKEWQPILEKVGRVILIQMGGAFGKFIDFLKVGIPAAVHIALAAIKAIGFVIDAVASAIRGDWGRALQDLKDIASVGSMNVASPLINDKQIGSHDKGGLFKGSSIIEVGEKRPEMVGALDDVFPMMVQAFREARGTGVHAPITINSPVNPRALARELAMELS